MAGCLDRQEEAAKIQFYKFSSSSSVEVFEGNFPKQVGRQRLCTYSKFSFH